jgi:hypothetical protein
MSGAKVTETVKRYIRKPEPIFAVKLTRENYLEVSLWSGSEVIEEGKASDPTDVYIALKIPTTVTNAKKANIGDYILKYASGKFGVLDAQYFEHTYEEAPVNEPV